MRTFDLGGGRSLVVDERDVELLLGFPRGPVEMVKRDQLEISNMLKHWRGKFEKTRHTVMCAELATKVKALVDGGLWFKRHFALLTCYWVFDNCYSWTKLSSYLVVFIFWVFEHPFHWLLHLYVFL